MTPAAVGQEAQAGQPADLITVTARRREESLQDVPVSVTAYSGAQLEQIGAQDITIIAQTTPNVTLEVSRGTKHHADRLHPRHRPAGSGGGL